jgi:hypothetical protein
VFEQIFVSMDFTICQLFTVIASGCKEVTGIPMAEWMAALHPTE